MAKAKELKDKIVEKLDGLNQDQLRQILVLLKNFNPSDAPKQRILAYAGIWKEMDNALSDELTLGLHKRRSGKLTRKDLRE